MKISMQNAFLTSNWYNGQSKLAAQESNVLTMLIFATGANISS
jgi:hypothetical protein